MPAIGIIIRFLLLLLLLVARLFLSSFPRLTKTVGLAGLSSVCLVWSFLSPMASFRLGWLTLISFFLHDATPADAKGHLICGA